MAKSHSSTLTVALMAVVVSSIVAAAGLTIAQTGSESWSCDMNATGEKGQGPTTCGGQGRPNWDQCIMFVCSTTSGGYGVGGSCPGSPPTSTSWCDMSTGTPTWKESGGGGSCPGSPPTSISWCDTATSTWRDSSGAGDSCSACMNAGGAASTCPSCSGYTGMGGGGTSCSACANMPAGTARDQCYNTPPCGGGGGSYSGGYGGGGGTQWCFYPKATWNGQELGYSIACPGGSMTDCHKYTQNGEKVDAAGLVLNASSQCWWEGGSGGGYGISGSYGTGGGYGGTGAGGMGGGSSMQRCFYPKAMMNGAPAGFTVWCLGDYNDCHEGSPSGRSIPNAGLSLGAPSSCESGWGGGSGGSGDPREQWIMSCMSSKSMSRPQCAAECDKQGSGCPGTGGGGDGGMRCRDKEGYYNCIGGRGSSTPSNSDLARSCEKKHCWFRDEDSGGTGGDGESCRRACEQNLRDCRQPRASVAYSPMWCNETLDECFAKCPGGGGKKPPEEDLVTICKKFPEHEKCKKEGRREKEPLPSTFEEKLAALEEKINALDTQIGGLRTDLQSTKDDITAKNDEIRALKKSGASHAEISAAQKELKVLKRAVSKIVSTGKKLTRELKFREREYDRLQGPPQHNNSF